MPLDRLPPPPLPDWLSAMLPDGMRRSNVVVEGRRLHLMEMSEPGQRPVLLLHGKNFSGAYWAPTIEILASEGYRVVVPDQIGFGKSSKPERFQYTLHGLAAHTDDLLDALGVERAHVVGHSMGGMLATRFAIEHPERVHRLALLNPIGLEDWQRVVPYPTVDEWYAGELQKTPEGIRAYMTESYFDGQWSPAYEPLVEVLSGWAVGPDRAQIAWTAALTADMIFTQPVLHDLDRVQAPTLLVVGDRDRTALGKGRVSPEVRATMGNYPVLAKAFIARIPDGRLELVKGIGHLPQFEAKEATHARLLKFLKKGR